MVMSNEEWLVFAQAVFDSQLKRILPDAEYELEIREKYILHWKLSAFGRQDFEFISRGELLFIYYHNNCANLQFAQYPDDDFEELVSDMLTVIAKYYAGDIDVVQHRTRHRKKLEYIFRDYDSGDFYHFTED